MKAEAGVGGISILVDVKFVLRRELNFPPSFLFPTYCLYHVCERDPWIELSVIFSLLCAFILEPEQRNQLDFLHC